MLILSTIEHSLGLAAQLAAGAACAERVAVKAVIWREGRLWLLHSPSWNCYKFLGGGVEGSESHAAAIRRELREEAGAELERLGPCLLTVTELSAAREAGAEVFRMVSYYYACEVVTEQHTPQPEVYEQALGFRPVWVTPEIAIQANALAVVRPTAPRWLRRETEVLRALESAGQP